MTTLDVRLSEIIGDGKNRAIKFGLDSTQGPETPLLVIRLNDDRLVEMRLTRTGNARFGTEEGDERIVLYHRSGVVRVINSLGETLTEQKYERIYDQQRTR